jgi:hypothetical protein
MPGQKNRNPSPLFVGGLLVLFGLLTAVVGPVLGCCGVVGSGRWEGGGVHGGPPGPSEDAIKSGVIWAASLLVLGLVMVALGFVVMVVLGFVVRGRRGEDEQPEGAAEDEEE